MRDWRLIIFAVLAAVAAAAIVVMVVLPSQVPLPPPAPANFAKAKPLPEPKRSARILAPTTLNYFKVRVALDGTLRTGRHTFHLYAVDVPGREYTCRYRDGRRWACGLQAYVALLNLVGSEPIECHPRNNLEPNIVICHKEDGVDLSEWMLKQGWARLVPGVKDKRYVNAAEAATAAQAGMWASAAPLQQGTAAR